LKKAYGEKIAENIRLGINHIDKSEFLVAYQQARLVALSSSNIRSGFTATGIVPYNPDQVLSRLQVKPRTPTPPLQSDDQHSEGPDVLQTPYNVIQLQAQAQAIKQFRQHHPQDPPSPTDQALSQLVKGCQIAMHNAVLLAHENKEVRAANQRQKKKQEKPRSYIAQGGVLTVEEGTRRAENREIEQMGGGGGAGFTPGGITKTTRRTTL
jgi:hypothetical protein